MVGAVVGSGRSSRSLDKLELDEDDELLLLDDDDKLLGNELDGLVESCVAFT
jgi:hypothetical protein